MVGVNKHRNQGVGLIEVLIALLVVSLGLLGIAILQLQSLKGATDALQRSQVVWLANGIIDRMRQNQDAVINNRYSDVAATPLVSLCQNRPVKMCSANSKGMGADKSSAVDFIQVTGYSIQCTDANPADALPCSQNSNIDIVIQWESAAAYARIIKNGLDKNIDSFEKKSVSFQVRI